jgi:hypothetical protein
LHGPARRVMHTVSRAGGGTQGVFVNKRALLYNGSVKVHELIWSEDRIDHIASHGVEPEDV